MGYWWNGCAMGDRGEPAVGRVWGWMVGGGSLCRILFAVLAVRLSYQMPPPSTVVVFPSGFLAPANGIGTPSPDLAGENVAVSPASSSATGTQSEPVSPFAHRVISAYPRLQLLLLGGRLEARGGGGQGLQVAPLDGTKKRMAPPPGIQG